MGLNGRIPYCTRCEWTNGYLSRRETLCAVCNSPESLAPCTLLNDAPTVERSAHTAVGLSQTSKNHCGTDCSFAMHEFACTPVERFPCRQTSFCCEYRHPSYPSCSPLGLQPGSPTRADAGRACRAAGTVCRLQLRMRMQFSSDRCRCLLHHAGAPLSRRPNGLSA